MKKYLFLALAVLGLATFLAAQTAGSTMYVAVREAKLKNRTDFFASTLVSLKQGEAVTVLGVRGKWVEVRSGGAGGWTLSAGLSARKIVASGYAAGVGEIALAGKGFSGDLERVLEGQDKTDYSPVDLMESLEIPGEELYQFLTEGRLETGNKP
jgi:hypothetical protein